MAATSPRASERALRALRAGRVMGALAVAVIGGALVAAFWPSGGGGSSSYRVDAIFDVARGIGPQQVVKIAGAQVGSVTAVHLTRSYHARVEMTIDPRFAPFRTNASCQIVPEGLISENFVECSPGTAAAPVLSGSGGAAPTVPVAHTAEPITLQDLFNIWSTPVSERLSVLLDELGIGVSGQAGDIQAILDRADPGLAAARKAIALVNRQRAQLQQIVGSAAPVVGQLAAHDTTVQRFLASTARLATTTAQHRDALAASINRLPPLLRAARPALQSLDQVAASAPPLLAELRTSAPAINRLTTLLPPFADQAVSTMSSVSPALVKARDALNAAAPTLSRLAKFTVDADPAGEGLDRLLVSLRDSGALESLLRGVYNGASLTSHYDADSHVIFADDLENQCAVYATTPNPQCDAHTNGSAALPSSSSARRAAHRSVKPGRADRPANPRQPTPAPAPASGQPTSAPPSPAPSQGGITVPGVGSVPVPPVSPTQTPGRALDHLLGFLLK